MTLPGGLQGPRGRSALWFAAAILGVAVIIAGVHAAATLLTQHEGDLTASERLKATNDARMSVIQVIAGSALIGGLAYTSRTYSLTRRTQRSERYAKAITQIGDDASEAVRAGGVYGLWMLAEEDNDDQYWVVVEQVLASMLRGASPSEESGAGADAQAAVSVLGRRPARPPGHRDPPLDLRGARLRGLDLTRLDLARSRLDNADLSKAALTHADLRRATLRDGCLDEANLSNADLRQARLNGASLRGATLYQALVDGADFTGCDLTGVLEFTPEQRRLAVGVA